MLAFLGGLDDGQMVVNVHHGMSSAPMPTMKCIWNYCDEFRSGEVSAAGRQLALAILYTTTGYAGLSLMLAEPFCREFTSRLNRKAFRVGGEEVIEWVLHTLNRWADPMNAASFPTHEWGEDK